MYDPEIGRFTAVDLLADHPNQTSRSPYAYVWNNPVILTDPDGNCPNCITAAIGAGVGALIGGGIEIGAQLWNDGSVTNWNAVGGSMVQGGITGGAAGLTGGSSLLVTTSVGATANVVGGTANRTIQGQETTATDIIIDATTGGLVAGGSHMIGNYVSSTTNNLTPNAKGNLGEAVTEAKYATRGYRSQGNAVVRTGGRTPTGRVQTARYDHDMRNVVTGRQLTVESKFNGARLSRNQRAARPNVTTPGGVIVDRTTSAGLGRDAQATAQGVGIGVLSQVSSSEWSQIRAEIHD